MEKYDNRSTEVPAMILGAMNYYRRQGGGTCSFDQVLGWVLFDVKPATIKKHFQWLLKHNLIEEAGYDPVTGVKLYRTKEREAVANPVPFNPMGSNVIPFRPRDYQPKDFQS